MDDSSKLNWTLQAPQDKIKALEGMLYYACQQLESCLLDRATSDSVRLPGPLDEWYCNESDLRVAADLELRQGALRKLTPEEIRVLKIKV